MLPHICDKAGISVILHFLVQPTAVSVVLLGCVILLCIDGRFYSTLNEVGVDIFWFRCKALRTGNVERIMVGNFTASDVLKPKMCTFVNTPEVPMKGLSVRHLQKFS